MDLSTATDKESIITTYNQSQKTMSCKDKESVKHNNTSCKI